MIFPWFTFYNGKLIDYLAKEEMVSGAYGLEGRYPFLDFQVVQEFLWLSADKVKNREYKGVIADALRRRNYPFLIGKQGFAPMIEEA